MPMHPLVPVLARLAPPIFSQYFSRDSCVNATRVLLDVCAHFRVHAVPLSVSVVAANAAFIRCCEERDRMPKDQAESAEWWASTGAWSVGIDRSAEREDEWAGHVLAMVCGTLADGAAGQLARPSREILVPPMLTLEVPPGFMRGEVNAGYVHEPSGTSLVYQAHPEDTAYKRFPGFQRHEGNREVERELIGAVEQDRRQRSRAS